MHGWLSAPKGIVIHAGHIVVDQGKRVNALDGRTHLNAILPACRGSLSGCNGKERPNTLASTQHTIGHGLMQSLITAHPNGRSPTLQSLTQRRLNILSGDKRPLRKFQGAYSLICEISAERSALRSWPASMT
jgi:hypothetical protein